ncbi:hypothetical protein A5656_28445 [Mycobacterium gordonae]|nr:crossover junction endodeoxyribonuclease RuvC [Mycobacterium gordonae]OBK49417.1 hypothetical protein A5656_28445 [Mycobacterium gordonae]
MALICGIDPSLTSTGVAILRDGRPIRLRSVGSGTLNARDYDHRSDRIGKQLRDVMEAIGYSKWPIAGGKPDLAVIEGPAYGACNASTHDGSGLWWRIYAQLRGHQIPIATVPPMTRAKWATGKGNSKKREVVTAVRATWKPWAGHITNDDIADALTLAEIGARGCGDELHFTPRRRHIEAMHNSIAWPSGFGPKQQVGVAK